MKKLSYIFLAVIILFTASITSVIAQSESNRSVSGFNTINSEGPFEVYVKIDGTESLKISASSDIIALIDTKVENGVLKIKFQDNLKDGQGNTDGKIKVYVTAKSISSLVKIGSGSIKVDGVVVANNINIIVNGSGNIQSSVKSKFLNATITGSGLVDLNGSADMAKIIIDGPGGMNGGNLETKDASILINGSGNANLHAEKIVSSHVIGSGSVVYSGDAVVTVGSSGISRGN